MIFEEYLDLNTECRRSNRARYQLSQPPHNLATHALNLATFPPNLATHPPLPKIII
jgi:hypothetical protein